MTAERRTCSQLTVNGEPCKALAMLGSDSCYCHANPERWREANSAGGRAKRNRDTGVDASTFNLTTVEGVIGLVGEVLARTSEGQMEPRVANAVSALTNSLRAYLEVGELLARVEALENKQQ